MKYEDQIKSPKWQKRRLEILQRDNFTCQMCGCNDKTLHVHHLSYDSSLNIWEYPGSSLMTLCEDCHKREHDIENGKNENIWSIDDSLRSLRRNGVTNYEISALLEYARVRFLKNKAGIIDAVGDMTFVFEDWKRTTSCLNEHRKRIESV